MKDPCYVGRCVHGKVVFATVDNPERRESVARDVAEAIKSGLAIERMDVVDVKKQPWRCESCDSIVAEATRELRDRISTVLGAKLRPIVHVCQDKISAIVDVKMSERDLRIIRFNLNRSLESM